MIKKKRSHHQNYTEKTEMIHETKTSNLTNDYFGYKIFGDYFWLYTKSWERSNWKIEWRRKRKLKVSEGSCRSWLPCFIAVVLDFERLLGNKDKTNNEKRLAKIRHFNIWGPKPPGPKWKRAETSGGQIRKGSKPLATLFFRGGVHYINISMLKSSETCQSFSVITKKFVSQNNKMKRNEFDILSVWMIFSFCMSPLHTNFYLDFVSCVQGLLSSAFLNMRTRATLGGLVLLLRISTH